MKPTPISEEHFLSYFQAYARHERIPLTEIAVIETELHVRCDVGAAEFEYGRYDQTLIIRGLLNKRLSDGDPAIPAAQLARLGAMQLEAPDRFAGCTPEYDTSAGELNQQFPTRLNLRCDLGMAMEVEEFVRRTDSMMRSIYAFELNYYRPLQRETAKDL